MRPLESLLLLALGAVAGYALCRRARPAPAWHRSLLREVRGEPGERGEREPAETGREN